MKKESAFQQQGTIQDTIDVLQLLQSIQSMSILRIFPQFSKQHLPRSFCNTQLSVVCIINEDKKGPAFIRLNSIDMSKCVEYRDLDVLKAEEYDQKLTEIIEHQHRQIWPHLNRQPGQEVIVVQSKTIDSSSIAFDAVFAFHHAIADGLSGMVFHRSMLKALGNPSENAHLKDHVVTIPDSICLKPAIERVVNFKVSWRFFLGVLWSE